MMFGKYDKVETISQNYQQELVMSLTKRDHAAIWHPCSQMKDYEKFQPLAIQKARGSYLILQDGTRVLDAISSWWCKGLGHAHPRLRKALIEQSKKFEHVILANTTHDNIVELSERLIQLTGSNRKIFYASEGSSAIEIALKMVAHARQIRGQTKTLMAGLANGYHGETLFAMSVSDVPLYGTPYQDYLINSHVIQDIPYVNSINNSSYDAVSKKWLKIELQLNDLKRDLSAIIVEPIIQGAGGMLIYSPDFLSKLSTWCQRNDVYLIVDEIMTGFGRTGRMFGYQHAAVNPDIICLGKGLTSGYLPMSAVLAKNAIYDLFYDDYRSNKAFLHSHTQSGNALAAAVALETLNVIDDEDIIINCNKIEKTLNSFMLDVAAATKRLGQIRYIGGVVAADIITAQSTQRVGYAIYQEAVRLGALLRPLGNTIYWLPPLNSCEADLKRLRDITIKAIMSVLN
jgi:adenosylmethionine---8-amino-7-oxononanoate aminotransferase